MKSRKKSAEQAEKTPKPTLFIGSSTESLSVARTIRAQLRREADATVWEKDIFQLGDTALVSLLRAIDLFDFAAFVLAKDDLTENRKRRQKQASARDNVIFELGLFCGQLGPRRTFIVSEEGVRIPSDLAGVTRATFTARSIAGIRNACERMRKAIRSRKGENELRLLPSTALAVGYFYNFLRPLHEALSNQRVLSLNGRMWNLRATPPHLTILIPNELGKAFPRGVAEVARGKALKEVRVQQSSRYYPLYVQADSAREKTLEFFDVPTTLSSCAHAVSLYLGKQTVGRTAEERELHAREIVNFERTLRNLRDEADHGMREFIRFGRV